MKRIWIVLLSVSLLLSAGSNEVIKSFLSLDILQTARTASAQEKSPISQNLRQKQLASVAPVLIHAHELANRYGTHPYWQESAFKRGEPVPADKVDDVIAHLMPCENIGRLLHPGTVEKIVDSNGFYSYGNLMFQSSTWHGMDSLFEPGEPTDVSDAIIRARWAIEHGYLRWWSCARILRLIH